MRGNRDYQVYQVLKNIDGIGKSKKENKSVPHLRGGLTTSPLIHSYNSKRVIEARCKELYDYVKEKFNRKDLQAITSEEIRSFIQSKVDGGLKKRSIDTIISQLEKIRSSLDMMEKHKKKGHENLFTREDLEACKVMAENGKASEHRNRAYKNPDKLINAISDEKCKIVAELQCDYGLRVSEANKLRESNFKEKDLIEVRGKGGYYILKRLKEDMVERIRGFIQREGKFFVSQKVYRSELERACKATKQAFQNTHGLRYNYAQSKYIEYLQQGYAPLEAQKMVSEEMGHHRADITMHYIKASKTSKKKA